MILVVLSEAAQSDIAEAVAWYDEREPGLGRAFAAEVLAAVHKIENFPEAWPPVGKRARRCLLDRFPYALYYRIYEAVIVVAGVLHLKQHPKHWRLRLRTFDDPSR